MHLPRWFAPVSAAMSEFAINTAARQTAFIAQIRHESAGFTQLTESFQLPARSARDLLTRTRFDACTLGRHPDEKTVPPARQQQIAHLAYANRYGNGDAASGDGWRYRGRGLKQITFFDNYRDCGRARRRSCCAT